MNILGVDFGTKNIGLAWTDTLIGVVLPYGIIRNKEQGIRNKELIDLIKKEKIDKVVIGLPMNFDGSENENTKRIRNFAEKLKKMTNIPIEFENEMFSSGQADRTSGGASRDEKSAMVILEEYLVEKRDKLT